MTRYDSMLLRFKAKYQTRLIMRRHRIWATDRITLYPYPAETPPTEGELRALWGDR